MKKIFASILMGVMLLSSSANAFTFLGSGVGRSAPPTMTNLKGTASPTGYAVNWTVRPQLPGDYIGPRPLNTYTTNLLANARAAGRTVTAGKYGYRIGTIYIPYYVAIQQANVPNAYTNTSSCGCAGPGVKIDSSGNPVDANGNVVQ